MVEWQHFKNYYTWHEIDMFMREKMTDIQWIVKLVNSEQHNTISDSAKQD